MTRLAIQQAREAARYRVGDVVVERFAPLHPEVIGTGVCERTTFVSALGEGDSVVTDTGLVYCRLTGMALPRGTLEAYRSITLAQEKPSGIVEKNP